MSNNLLFRFFAYSLDNQVEIDTELWHKSIPKHPVQEVENNNTFTYGDYFFTVKDLLRPELPGDS